MATVATEDLVAAIARQHDTDMVARDARERIDRDVRGIPLRLVSQISHLGEEVGYFCALHPYREVCHPASLRDALSEAQVSVVARGVEAQRKRTESWHDLRCRRGYE